MNKLILAMLVLCLTACTDSDKATRTLQQAGYTDIHTTGYVIFGCSEDDQYHTSFVAKGPTGVATTGVVCGGVFKGSTIRMD